MKRSFNELVKLVHDRHRDFESEDGALLRDMAVSVTLVCEKCGELPNDGVTYWIDLANLAVTHTIITGHRTVAKLWQAAVYGPDTDGERQKEAQEAAEESAGYGAPGVHKGPFADNH